MPNAPTTLGPYRLLRLLGEGGMARVYEGEHVETGARHAIKELLFRSGDLDALQRFRREAELAVALNHPHIARTHTADLSPPQPYLALELLGESLEDRLAAGPLSNEEARAVLDQVAAGVAHAHAQGVIHRDLKPGNVLFSAEGVAKVADFGIAVGARVERLTRTGELLGTPSYMAPEQIDDPHTVDARADVYALGAILYRVLSGQAPFAARSNLMSTLLAVRNEAPPPLPATVDPALAAACRTALAKDRGQRYPDAESFRAALHGAPFRARPRLAALGLALGLGLALVVTVALRGQGAKPAPQASSPSLTTLRSPSPGPITTAHESDATPLGLALMRRIPARRTRDKALATYTTDGSLAIYEHDLLTVGETRRELTWKGIVQRSAIEFPRYMVALDAGELVLGAPERALLWTAAPELNSHLGVTALASQADVVVAGSHPPFRQAVEASLRAMNHRGATLAIGAIGAYPVRALTISPGQVVYVGIGTLKDAIVGVGELSSWALEGSRFVLRHRRAVAYAPNAVALSPDGKWLAAGAVHGAVELLRASGLERVTELTTRSSNSLLPPRAHDKAVVGMRFLTSERLVSVGRAAKEAGMIRVWNVKTRALLAESQVDLVTLHVSIHVVDARRCWIAVSGVGGTEVWRYRE